MLFNLAYLLLAAALHAIEVIGGQVPVVDGVLGGVSNAPNKLIEPQLLKIAATTPGKLRVVENSGICGNICLTLRD